MTESVGTRLVDQRPQALLLGRIHSSEMQPVVAELARRTRVRLSLAEVAGEPDLLVVCQHWPDEFSSGEVCEWIAQFPLARLLCIYGPWCDGDGRSRSIWPLAARVPLADFSDRLDVLLREVAGITRYGLPLTASRSEIFEATRCRNSVGDACARGAASVWPPVTPVRVRQPLMVMVDSPDRSWRAMLEQALTDCGASVTPDADAADRIVWDVDPDTPSRNDQLAALQARAIRAKWIFAQGFWHVPEGLTGRRFWKLAALSRQMEIILADGNEETGDVL